MTHSAVTVRFVEFDITRSAATYGSGTYGTDTYGQESSDPLSNIVYNLCACPNGRSLRSSGVGWETWVGDTELFLADLHGYNGSLDLVVISSAILVLDALNPGNDAHRVFTLVVNDTDDRFEYDWATGDPLVSGMYRVSIVATTVSGRRITWDSSDQAKLLCRGGV